MAGRDVLILGTGPGVAAHCSALEAYIHRSDPLVIALNTQSGIHSSLIDFRIACHPVRLLADVETYANLPQPLITPASMLPEDLRVKLGHTDLLDFGLGIEVGKFEFHDSYCITPCSLVLAYSLAVAKSGQAARILMAGFDGYPAGDPRNDETDAVLETYYKHSMGSRLLSITPTRHRMEGVSIYCHEL
jgi:4-hydroxy 2-oxovalerate aldolase